MMLLYYRPLSRPRRWQSSQRAELQVIHQSSSLCKKTSSQRLEFTLAHGQWPSWLVRGLPGDNLEAWGERGLGRGIWMTYGRRHERWRPLNYMLILTRDHLWWQTLNNQVDRVNWPSLSSATPVLGQCMKHSSHDHWSLSTKPTAQAPTHHVPAADITKPPTCGTIPQSNQPAIHGKSSTLGLCYPGEGSDSTWIGQTLIPGMCLPFLSTSVDSITIQRPTRVSDPPTRDSAKHYLRPRDPLHNRGAVAAGVWPWDLLLLSHTVPLRSLWPERAGQHLLSDTAEGPSWRWYPVRMAQDPLGRSIYPKWPVHGTVSPSGRVHGSRNQEVELFTTPASITHMLSTQV